MMNAHRSSPLQSTKKEGTKKERKKQQESKAIEISPPVYLWRNNVWEKESENRKTRAETNKQTNKQKRKPRRFLRSLQVFAKNKDTMKTTTKLHCGKIGMLTHHRRTRSSQSTSLPRSTAAQVMTPTLISLLP